MTRHTAGCPLTSRDSKEAALGRDKRQKKFRIESPLVSGPEEFRYGKRSFIASQTETEMSHVSE